MSHYLELEPVGGRVSVSVGFFVGLQDVREIYFGLSYISTDVDRAVTRESEQAQIRRRRRSTSANKKVTTNQQQKQPFP